MRLPFAVAVLVACVTEAHACQPVEILQLLVLEDGDIRIEVSPHPVGIRAGRQFSLTMKAGQNSKIVGIDAQMPRHGHGMNYRPRLSETGDGAVQAEGLLFHMAGTWRLTVDIERGGKRVQLSEDVSICP